MTSRGAANCSGDMKGGVPISLPVTVRVWLSAAREMPKSMTRGPSSASSTLLGFKSRCTTPAWWMSRSASTRPRASVRRARPVNGPSLSTTSASVRPGTYSVAIHGTSASASASTTGAVKAPLTRRTAAISCRKRARNSSSSAYCACTTLTATCRPEADRPRYTTPIPPLPSRSTSAYPPIDSVSPGRSDMSPVTFPDSVRGRAVQTHHTRAFVPRAGHRPCGTRDGRREGERRPGGRGERKWVAGPGRSHLPWPHGVHRPTARLRGPVLPADHRPRPQRPVRDRPRPGPRPPGRAHHRRRQHPRRLSARRRGRPRRRFAGGTLGARLHGTEARSPPRTWCTSG